MKVLMQNKLFKNFIMMFSFLVVLGFVFCANSITSEAYVGGRCSDGVYNGCNSGRSCGTRGCGCSAHPDGGNSCWYHWDVAYDDICCCTGHNVSYSSFTRFSGCNWGFITGSWHCSICNRDFTITPTNTNDRSSNHHGDLWGNDLQFYVHDNNASQTPIFNDLSGNHTYGCPKCGRISGGGAICVFSLNGGWVTVKAGDTDNHSYGEAYKNKYGFRTHTCDAQGSHALFGIYEKDCGHTYYDGCHFVFDSNGGSAVSSLYNQGWYNSVDLSTPTRDGYTFAGWKVTGGNTSQQNKIFSGNQNVSTLCNKSDGGTVYLQAQWDKNVNINYWSNMGSGGSADFFLPYYIGTDKVYKDNSFTTRNAPTRQGYKFVGWQTFSINGGSINNGIFASRNSDMLSGRKATVVNARENHKPNQWANFNTRNVGNDDVSINLVAIWEHKHPSVKGQGISLSATDGNIVENDIDVLSSSDGLDLDTYYVKGSSSNKLLATYNAGQLVNGSSYTSLSGKLQYRTQNGSWTDYPKDGLKGSWIASQPNQMIYIRGQSSYKCSWHDYYCSCNPSEIMGESTYRVIADSTAPVNDGDENYKNICNLKALDRGDVASYVIKPFFLEDTIYNSGLKSYSINARNLDNGLSTTYYNYATENGYGHIKKAIVSDIIDITKLSKQYNGDYVITLTAEDRVGNTMKKTINMSTFEIEATLTSQTFNPTRYKDGLPLFLQGEAGRLTVKTYGYANALAIQFPSEWYVSEQNPLYIYWGDVNNYDSSKLQKIEQDVFYIKNDNPVDIWTQDFVFIVPVGKDIGNEDSPVKNQIGITGYKGDVTVIENKSIDVNVGTTAKIKKLYTDVDFYIGGDIYKQFKTRINNTYRAKGTK